MPVLLPASRRKPAEPAAGLPLAPGVTLASGRVHEACGQSRLVFALAVAGLTEGPLLWLRRGVPAGCYGARAGPMLNACGLAPWFNPGRLIIAVAPHPVDLLWCMEEALRSGAVPLVVAEFPEPPALTPVRRLQLAAEAGADVAGSGAAPTGLLLTPGDGGAAGVETRWHMAPLPGWATPAGHPAWALTRARARAAPPASWRAERGARGLALGPLDQPAAASRSVAASASPP